MSPRQAERTTTFIGWLGQAAAWAIMLGVAAVLAASVLVPRLIGATPYTILTGSMEPSMPPGTLVVVKPVPAEEIAIGSVITYQLRSGEPTVVTHRVIGVGSNGKGESVFSTQGDANNVPDAVLVRAVQVRGERVYHVPYIGKVTTLITSSQRGIASAVIVTGLFGYAGSMFLAAARERRRSAQATPTNQTIPTNQTKELEEVLT